ncbi:MAG: phytoene desaturase family protein [Polyangiales bacterium]
MSDHVVIVGGGLAGLSAGCYARASGFRTTIVEHNLALGGVCTAWERSGYTIDGCIHWLTGGAFEKLYRELGILPRVRLHTIEEFARYRHVERNLEIAVTRDLDALARDLSAVAPEDAPEVQRMMRAAIEMTGLEPPIDTPSELQGITDAFAQVWDNRKQIGTLVHYRKPSGAWLEEHIRSPYLRRFFLGLVPPEAPALFLLFMLGYLAKGFLSRPDGGTGRFRDALIDTYRRLGGEERLHATVDEILVESGRARGVRLADGTMLDADVVISTSSVPETVLRLLGGRHGAKDARHRLENWKLFDPIALVSFGVASALEAYPQTLLVDGIPSFEIGGRRNDRLLLRVFNDDRQIASPGHTVVQAMLTTDYDWWAKRGTGYTAAKDQIVERALELVETHLPYPGFRKIVRVTDIATPITYWNMARSWRGAFEGWMPRNGSMFDHMKKTLPGLESFYMAGQWVEPGGGVPTAIHSGRQVIQLLCKERNRTFSPP